MGALALFCGAHFRNRWLAFRYPLASMLLGDVLLGLSNHDIRLPSTSPSRSSMAATG